MPAPAQPAAAMSLERHDSFNSCQPNQEADGSFFPNSNVDATKIEEEAAVESCAGLFFWLSVASQCCYLSIYAPKPARKRSSKGDARCWS
jgi:hypothetical protein